MDRQDPPFPVVGDVITILRSGGNGAAGEQHLFQVEVENGHSARRKDPHPAERWASQLGQIAARIHDADLLVAIVLPGPAGLSNLSRTTGCHMEMPMQQAMMCCVSIH